MEYQDVCPRVSTAHVLFYCNTCGILFKNKDSDQSNPGVGSKIAPCPVWMHQTPPHLHYAQCGCSDTAAVQVALKDAMDKAHGRVSWLAGSLTEKAKKRTTHSYGGHRKGCRKYCEDLDVLCPWNQLRFVSIRSWAFRSALREGALS